MKAFWFPLIIQEQYKKINFWVEMNFNIKFSKKTANRIETDI
jgi:hypothetical protein